MAEFCPENLEPHSLGNSFPDMRHEQCFSLVTIICRAQLRPIHSFFFSCRYDTPCVLNSEIYCHWLYSQESTLSFVDRTVSRSGFAEDGGITPLRVNPSDIAKTAGSVPSEPVLVTPGWVTKQPHWIWSLALTSSAAMREKLTGCSGSLASTNVLWHLSQGLPLGGLVSLQTMLSRNMRVNRRWAYPLPTQSSFQLINSCRWSFLWATGSNSDTGDLLIMEAQLIA